MDMIQVQLPATLVRQVRQTIAPDKALEQALIEAIQMWLDNQRREQDKTEEEQALAFLRHLGLVMTEERQHAFAQSIVSTLEVNEPPDREEVENALAHLDPPLSQEILSMRGEH